MSASEVVWADVLARMIDDSHLVTGDDLSALVDRVIRPLGLTGELLVVDLAQRTMTSLRPGSRTQVGVEGTLAGRAYQLGEIFAGADEAVAGGRVLWVPVLDGTDRVGVLRIGLDQHAVDDARLRRWCWVLSGLLGHLTISKLPYSERLRWLRSNGPLTASAELLWQLLPPRTFATEKFVVTALLEPYDRVAGDAYDYAVNANDAYLAVFDGLGHDIQAGQATALAITAVRKGRREGVADLAALAARADDLLMTLPGPRCFVTAALATLDTDTGMLRYVLAGHPPPLLIRRGRTATALAHPPRSPLGVLGSPPARLDVGRQQLEPGDRLLMYSDGIVEARDVHGEFFGERRLVDFVGRAELDQLSAPETLRRLGAAVLAHQDNRLQDDASLIMLDWSPDAHRRMLPGPPGRHSPL